MKKKEIKFPNARSLLSGCATHTERVGILSRELASQTSALNAHRAATLGQDSGGSEQAMAAMTETATMLTKEIEREETRYRLALDALSTLDDPKVKSALEYRYLNGMGIKVVAQKMDYSTDSIKRFLREGLAAVEMYLETYHIGVNDSLYYR